MAEFKTLQFPNTPRGQAEKVRTLQEESANGWRVVSETIVPGKYRTENACCLFLIFAPCAFLAGYKDDIINVTLQRDTGPVFDLAKWNALLQYDNEVATAAEKLRPFGQKWIDEFAASYLVLNDKSYLPEILEKVSARAREEANRLEEARNRAEGERQERERERERVRQVHRAQAAQLGKLLWGSSKRRVLTGIGVGLVLTTLAVVALWPGDAALTNCDIYAASDLDPQHKTRGVRYEDINTALAIPACEWAVMQYPNSSRLIYQLGRAHAKNNDDSAALVQFRKAADQGYAPAQYNLGVMYERGEGVKKNDAQAAVLYRQAAEQGFVSAQNNLGNMYADGRGVPQNYAEAVKWVRRAADHGEVKAQNNLGSMYATGKGVSQSDAEAAKWFRKAADQGNADAQFMLGVMYSLGQGVEANYTVAAQWFRNAAEQGNSEAQLDLGKMNEAGLGVPKSLAEAEEWYRKAAAQGDAKAQSKLAALDADARVARAAEEAGNAVLRKALAAGKTANEAWEAAALAASRVVLDAELAAGRTQEVARQAAQQVADQVRARAPQANVGAPGTITVEMSLDATSTNPPVITGTTNLPDGTALSVTLTGDMPACYGHCSFLANATVKNGHFAIGAELTRNEELIPDSYTIDITTSSATFEPQSVQAVIGNLGQNLRGPYVVTLENGGRYAPVQFPPHSAPSQSEQLIGLMIRYIRRLVVTDDGKVFLTPSSSNVSSETGSSQKPETETPLQPQGVTSPSTGPNAPTDPYAGSEKAAKSAHYKKARDAYLEEVRIMYFAFGCKVFGPNEPIGLLQVSGLRLTYEGQDNGIFVDSYIEGERRAAIRDGMARAARPGECNYWRNNPELVYEMRRQEAAALGTIH